MLATDEHQFLTAAIHVPAAILLPLARLLLRGDKHFIIEKGEHVIATGNNFRQLPQVCLIRAGADAALRLRIQQTQVAVRPQDDAGERMVEWPAVVIAAAQRHGGGRFRPGEMAHVEAAVGEQQIAADEFRRFRFGKPPHRDISVVIGRQVAIQAAEDGDAHAFEGGEDFAHRAQRQQCLKEGGRRIGRHAVQRRRPGGVHRFVRVGEAFDQSQHRAQTTDDGVEEGVRVVIRRLRNFRICDQAQQAALQHRVITDIVVVEIHVMVIMSQTSIEMLFQPRRGIRVLDEEAVSGVAQPGPGALHPPTLRTAQPTLEGERRAVKSYRHGLLRHHLVQARLHRQRRQRGLRIHPRPHRGFGGAIKRGVMGGQLFAERGEGFIKLG
ncbi:MAG: hypothetical protein BWY76_03119 [bacterium ADurb.Bin429]|nr:MAG: hypothetical protein BWY76_03119 [bacterium ADurb.Bin429]